MAFLLYKKNDRFEESLFATFATFENAETYVIDIMGGSLHPIVDKNLYYGKDKDGHDLRIEKYSRCVDYFRR